MELGSESSVDLLFLETTLARGARRWPVATLVKLPAAVVSCEQPTKGAHGFSAIQPAMSSNATPDIPRSAITGWFLLPALLYVHRARQWPSS